jgi:uncharacterized SAM-binding protein YcdF (DUF218 family)
MTSAYGTWILMASFVTVIFFLYKMIENQYTSSEDQEPLALKKIVRDIVVVFGGTMIAQFVAEQLSPLINEVDPMMRPVTAFTDNPEF